MASALTTAAAISVVGVVSILLTNRAVRRIAVAA
jgi:hypothetical protein